MKVLIRIFLYIAAFSIAGRFMLPWIVFHPTREISWTPAEDGIEFENIFFDTDDGMKLNAWFVPCENERGTVMFFHGNAGNISHRSESIKIFNLLGLSVFIFDYRGYGESEGSPTIYGVNRDAVMAWEWLQKNKGSENIVVFGRSLGGAIALQFIKNVNPPVKALILESTFSSLADMTGVDFISRAVRLLVTDAWNSADTARNLTVKTLCVHSPDDDVVPYRLGKRLFDTVVSQKSFLEIRGDHNYGFMESMPDYANGLNEFLNKVLPAQKTVQIIPCAYEN